jgi:hypothetical protein
MPETIRRGVRTRAFIAMVLAVASAAIAAGITRPATAADGYVISGRIADPHQLRPEDAILTLGIADGDGGVSSSPIGVDASGSFVTPPVKSGVYVLKVVRTPHSRTAPAIDVAYEIVRVTTAAVRDVEVTIRRDTATTGTFRMQSDDPAAPWPSYVGASAYSVIDGHLLDVRGADGAPAGQFVLRNAYGARLLRVNYLSRPGRRWSPSRVLLDGRDITDVPTDFSAVNGRLEVWLTEHPSTLAGRVADTRGAPVSGAWVLASSDDPAQRHAWSLKSHVVQTDEHGVFRFHVLPGRYLLRARPPMAFRTPQGARRQLDQPGPNATIVDVGTREVKRLALEAR